MSRAAPPLQTVVKEGTLQKQTSSFQRWKRRYFKLRGRTLYYAQTSKVRLFMGVPLSVGCTHRTGGFSPDPCAEWISVCLQSIIFDEVDLTDASVAESSTKNVNNSFTVSLSTSAAESSPCRLCGSEYSGVLTAAPSAGLMLFSFQCPLRVG